MNSKPDEFMVRLCAHALEGKLLQYLTAVGPYYTLNDLQELLSNGPRPVFNSENDLAAFNTKILSNVVVALPESEVISQLLSERLRRELRSGNSESTKVPVTARPPFNAEYVLYLLLRKEERDVAIGDLIEEYGTILERFNKRRADIWFYKQMGGSLLPLLRRALVRIGALVWLGRILRRLVS
jgi:hypothetical protein